jgi:hypothetical protein
MSTTATNGRHTPPFGAAAMRRAAQDRAAAAPQAMPSTALGLCAHCLGERKFAEMQMFAALGDAAPEQQHLEALPPVLPALCLIGGTGVCVGHVQVGRQSALLGPDGNPVSFGVVPQ